MSSYKHITEKLRASYDENHGDPCFSLYIGCNTPCGFVNARISPSELKQMCTYLLKEIEQIETKLQ